MRNYARFEDPQPEDYIGQSESVIPMVPCTLCTTEYEIEQLQNAMEELFSTNRLGSTSLLQTCTLVFSEVASNAVIHSKAPGAYVLAQQRPLEDGCLIELAVADCGIGIWQSLLTNPDNPPCDSDADAIQLALKEGVSSLQDPHRGYGLYHVTGDVKKDAERIMTVRSGYGILTVRGDGEILRNRSVTHYPGTIVSVTIPCT